MRLNFRENNKACVLIYCRLVLSSTHFGERDNLKNIYILLDNDGEDFS